MGTLGSFESYGELTVVDGNGREWQIKPLPFARSVYWFERLAEAQGMGDASPARAAEASEEILTGFPIEVGLGEAALSVGQMWDLARRYLHYGSPTPVPET